MEKVASLNAGVKRGQNRAVGSAPQAFGKGSGRAQAEVAPPQALRLAGRFQRLPPRRVGLGFPFACAPVSWAVRAPGRAGLAEPTAVAAAAAAAPEAAGAREDAFARRLAGGGGGVGGRGRSDGAALGGSWGAFSPARLPPAATKSATLMRRKSRSRTATKEFAPSVASTRCMRRHRKPLRSNYQTPPSCPQGPRAARDPPAALQCPGATSFPPTILS